MHLTLSSPSGLLAAAALLTGLVAAISPPTYNNYTIIWEDAFTGPAGSSPDTSRWEIITGYLNVNGEAEVYSSSSRNLQLSGGDSVQLVPQKDPSSKGTGAGWTSSRIETNAPFTPAAGRLTRVEGSIRMGSNPASQKQGIWPAFWMLGDSIRTGTGWPLCGELDILEQRNGVATGFGTAHCGSSGNGGLCNEPNGLGSRVSIPGGTSDDNFHTWSVTWDLTSSSWQNQNIVWALDGRSYYTLTGQKLGDEATWSVLAHSPFNIVLNVAVGGGFPGAPNSATQGGFGSMMEVQYVAVYST